MTRYFLTCAKCGGTDFRIIHSDDEPAATSILSIGTVCAECGQRSLVYWPLPPPEPAGGLTWQ